jgi:hypothetical protein
MPGFLTGWIKDSATKRRDPDGELPTSVGGKPSSGKWFNHFGSDNSFRQLASPECLSNGTFDLGTSLPGIL